MHGCINIFFFFSPFEKFIDYTKTLCSLENINHNSRINTSEIEYFPNIYYYLFP